MRARKFVASCSETETIADRKFVLRTETIADNSEIAQFWFGDGPTKIERWCPFRAESTMSSTWSPEPRWFHTQALQKVWTDSLPPTPNTADDFGAAFGCTANTEEEEMIASELHAIWRRLASEDDELAHSMKSSWAPDNSQEPEAIFRRLDLDGRPTR